VLWFYHVLCAHICALLGEIIATGVPLAWRDLSIVVSKPASLDAFMLKLRDSPAWHDSCIAGFVCEPGEKVQGHGAEDLAAGLGLGMANQTMSMSFSFLFFLFSFHISIVHIV
jgi:hypothetical protein